MRAGTIRVAPTRRSMARRLMRSTMICCQRVSVLDTNRARDGRALRHAHLRTPGSRATVALPFTLMCAIIAVGSTCQSLICEARRNQSVSATLGIGGNCRRRLLVLCSDLCQVGIMKHLRGQDGNLHQYRPVICRASMEVNFRWTTTAERSHQGKDNVLLFPTATKAMNGVGGSVCCREQIGGLLKYYHREAA